MPGLALPAGACVRLTVTGRAESPGARPDDVLLSFDFDARDRQLPKEDADGQGTEENEPGSAKAQAAEGETAGGQPIVP